MTFLHPTYLWTLLGLAVPLAIHLWSRKKVKIIKVGSTQFLESVDPKQTNSVKWNELWLLIIRMVVISLLALILAQPRLVQTAQNTPITYLIEPSLLADERIAPLIDSLPRSSLYLLQSGFPELNRDDVDGIDDQIPNYWQLAQEMESIPTDSIVVFTNAFQNGLKGMRPEIKANVQWVGFDEVKSREGIIEANINEKEVTLLKASGSSQQLAFEKQMLPIGSEQIQVNARNDSIKIGLGTDQIKLSLSSISPIKTHIVFEDGLSGQMKYIASAFIAIGSYLNRTMEMHSEMISDTLSIKQNELLVWLSEKPVPKSSGSVLTYRPDSLSKQLIVPGLQKNTYHLTRLLNVENIVGEHLVTQLIPLLDLHPDLQEKTSLYDQRAVAIDELRPIKTTVSKQRKNAQFLDLSPWLWAFLFIMLIMERIVAKYRRQ